MRTGKRNSTGANRGNGEGILCSLRSLLLNSGRGGEADFAPAASGLSTINFQPSAIQKRREYKAVYVQNDAEIGLFSDEVVVNCAVNQERLSATID